MADERILPGARDFEALQADVEARYMPAYLPEIRDAGGNSIGRRYRALHIALIDDAHLHTDQAYREGFLDTCVELASAVRIARSLYYNRRGPSGARVTLRFRTIDGNPAGAGGISIPQWTSATTTEAPTLRYLTLEPATIPEGNVSVDVAAAQGERRTSVLLHAGAPGTADLVVPVPASKPELELTEIRVDGVTWTRVESLADSRPTDQHFEVRFSPADTGEVVFGDGEYGYIPPAGAPIEADYVLTRGSTGGVQAGLIQRVIGALAVQVTVNNPAASTAGFDGDTIEDIKRRAPANLATAWRAVHERDAEELALRIPGVYRAQAVPTGARLNLYVQGDGGETAPQSVLDEVLSYITSRKVTGTTVRVAGHSEAEIVLAAQVILSDRSVDRARARGLVLQALQEAGSPLYWSTGPFGKNLTLTAVAAAMKIAGVSEVDVTQLTRRPAVVQSNLAAPALASVKILVNATEGSTWVITAIDSTTYQVARNGALEPTIGAVGVAYTPSAAELMFTLGTVTDALTGGDSWTFDVSPYRGNVQLGAGEIPTLRSISDVNLDVVYSDEV